MSKPKRAHVQAAAQMSATPPDELTESQFIARVVKAEGNNRWTCELPNKKPILVELDSLFRNTVFIRRGGYVLVDLASADECSKSSRVVGEIINVVSEEREWRKQPYWPKNFIKSTYGDDEDEDTTVGKMPPSDSEGEEEP
ncbi:putative RNA-binding protein EIF1AD [Madurella mycetomatis]|uniref:RNA-binding protein EIF1AD n=1 Tax=Madurella mycetomatis TaxID=100816 RepID=A0A175WE17_9PEZI|nr:putative RNA-binding protein EIF1AD [Madurella mycetomatis]